MLANLRRKVGLATGVNTPVPVMPPPTLAENMIVSPTFTHSPNDQQPFTMEELGFVWPSDKGIFSPSAIPVWLQEQVCVYASFGAAASALTYLPCRA